MLNSESDDGKQMIFLRMALKGCVPQLKIDCVEA